MKSAKTLRLVLGDQLNASHSWFKRVDDDVLYVIAELQQELDYCLHHVQKICAFFAAMENFADALQRAGHRVHYLTLDDSATYADLPALIESTLLACRATLFQYQRADEYRLLAQLRSFSPSTVTVEECDSEHFLLPFDEIAQQFKAGKHRRMENFYRGMRQRYCVLMDDDLPRGGRWNFDSENRHRLSADDIAELPEPLVFANDVSEILQRLERHGAKHFGRPEPQILWPVNRRQARELLDYFCRHLLPRFGRFQDAMTAEGPKRWSLYHSRLSFAINAKILHPMQVINAALHAFETSDGAVDLAQVEGFVRQILGWREFVRGVYWANMPRYAELNNLAACRELPSYFWTGKTNMRCLSQAIGQSLDYAYAHHIQRLMVTGNFCLLTGIDPTAVDQWYLGVYVDALEWVEMPNTRGMSQYADGGLVGTKAYAAGGNYIRKMSDYCGDCAYRVQDKIGDKACPLNSLYWDFMHRHRHRFGTNPRQGMIYKNWDKMADENKQAILDRAQWCLDHIEEL
ncbi:cryptochrome/photolyase family protein [Zhongshania sp. BJYM1]|uniref:cryptochrome/photolyase family protein n=1 Tax=Zhongshania aquatica TaxID=2965069 RepID=UPI0022B56AD9|nr:cryptochrome/photolyase family protein [Marortus sp. BJYM1]